MADRKTNEAHELAALEAELAGLPAALATAVRTGDEAEFSRLVFRERQLPILIAGLKSEAVLRRIAEVEAEYAVAEAEGVRALEDERTAHEAIKQAQAAEKASTHSFAAARRRQGASLMRREVLDRQLDDLRAELAALGA